MPFVLSPAVKSTQATPLRKKQLLKPLGTPVPLKKRTIAYLDDDEYQPLNGIPTSSPSGRGKKRQKVKALHNPQSNGHAKGPTMQEVRAQLPIAQGESLCTPARRRVPHR